MTSSIIKSIGAVLAGFLTVVIFSMLTDSWLETLGVFPSPDEGMPSWWMLLIALIYRTGYAALGGYVAALLAPHSPRKHALWLAVIGTTMGILGTVANWNKTELATVWYPILLLPLSFVAVWWGGKGKTK